jgi:hypothetical protein
VRSNSPPLIYGPLIYGPLIYGPLIYGMVRPGRLLGGSAVLDRAGQRFSVRIEGLADATFYPAQPRWHRHAGASQHQPCRGEVYRLRPHVSEIDGAGKKDAVTGGKLASHGCNRHDRNIYRAAMIASES